MNFPDTSRPAKPPIRAVNEIVAIVLFPMLLGSIIGYAFAGTPGAFGGLLLASPLGLIFALARKKLFVIRLSNNSI